MKKVSKENEKQFFDWTFEFGARKPVSKDDGLEKRKFG